MECGTYLTIRVMEWSGCLLPTGRIVQGIVRAGFAALSSDAVVGRIYYSRNRDGIIYSSRTRIIYSLRGAARSALLVGATWC